MKKLIVAFSLLLASGYVANTVYAATGSTVKSEVSKDDKKKKKSKKTEAKSCSTSTSTTGKSCCASKK